MSIYKQLQTSLGNRDAESWSNIYHNDFVFVRHQTGTTMNKSEMTEMLTHMLSNEAVVNHESRCIYENDEILVEHSVMSFPDGTREAIIGVHTIQDGKIIRSETGATPLSNE